LNGFSKRTLILFEQEIITNKNKQKRKKIKNEKIINQKRKKRKKPRIGI
jgi:ABC-type uncharacterized transport system ATPase component